MREPTGPNNRCPLPWARASAPRMTTARPRRTNDSAHAPGTLNETLNSEKISDGEGLKAQILKGPVLREHDEGDHDARTENGAPETGPE